MPSSIGLAAIDANTPLAPLSFDRQTVGPEDVRIDIEFCGIGQPLDFFQVALVSQP